MNNETTSLRNTFPVYYAPELPDYGTRETRVEVGRWGTIYPAGGTGSAYKGQIVVAYGSAGQQIYREVLSGSSHWDANTRNNLGQMGAVRFDAPTAKEREAAIDRALDACVAEANLLSEAPPLRGGWSAWKYVPPVYPDEDSHGGKRAQVETTWRIPRREDSVGMVEYAVTGRDAHWRIITNDWSSGAQDIFYNEPEFTTAEEAMIVVEQAAQS